MFAFYNIHQLPLFQPESDCGTTNHDNSRLFRHLGENLVDLKIVSMIVSMLSPLTCSRIRRNSVLFLSNSKDSYVTLGFLWPRAPAIWLDKMVIFCEISGTEFWTFSSCWRSRAVGWERFSYLQRNAFSGQKRKERLPNSFLKPLNFNASHRGDDSEKYINIGGAILLQRKHTGERER